MLARIVLLIVGVLALAAGVVLSLAWFQQGSGSVPQAEVKPPVTISVLVAAKPIAAGTLLRLQDMSWKNVAETEVIDPGFVRGKITEADLTGSVARQALQAQEPLAGNMLAKPGDREFLTATLAPGLRAVSVNVDAAQSTSGLVLPGDRVDVILTQGFQVQANDLRHKTVGETVLHDLRVIAVDQTSNPTVKPVDGKAGSAEFRVPRTVTLEVTERQAEALLVADQLGKIQLALRGREQVEAAAAPSAKDRPIWASEVSPALENMGSVAAPAAPDRSLGSIEVMHGGKTERRCPGPGGYVACP